MVSVSIVISCLLKPVNQSATRRDRNRDAAGDVHVVVVRDAVSRRDGEVAAHRVVGHFNDTMALPCPPSALWTPMMLSRTE